MFGFAVRKTKHNKYFCIVKDGASGNMYAPDHTAIAAVLPPDTQNVSENVYLLLDKAVDVETALTNAGFQPNDPHATNILDYMKEMGSLKNYKP